MRSEIVSIHHQIREYRKIKATYEARIEKTPRVEEQYKALALRQMNTQVKYNDLMQKHMEAKVAHGLEKGQKGERFTLIDPPRLPEKPFKPNRMAIILIGLVLGAGAGVSWAVLREFADPSVRSSETLAMETGFPVLGSIPNVLTRRDVRRIRIRRAVAIFAISLVIIGGVIAFHLWVMDLNVFWAKLNRRLVL